MSTERADYVVAMSRMLVGLYTMGGSVETSDVSGRPAIEHLVEAYDALTKEDWPVEHDATWRVMKAASLAASCFHLGASIEESEVNGEIVIDILRREVLALNAPAIAFD